MMRNKATDAIRESRKDYFINTVSEIMLTKLFHRFITGLNRFTPVFDLNQ